MTMMQAKEADKMLWKKMAESIRGSILIRPDGKKPMEVQFALLVNDPEVQFLMMSMPRAQPRAGPYDDLRDGKGKGKDEKGKGKKGKGKGFELPQGCSQTTKEEKNQFAMHTIVSSVRMPKMGSGARGVSMFVGNASGQNHMPPVPMSDSTTVTHQESVSSHLQVLLIAVLQTASSLILSCQI